MIAVQSGTITQYNLSIYIPLSLGITEVKKFAHCVKNNNIKGMKQ